MIAVIEDMIKSYYFSLLTVRIFLKLLNEMLGWVWVLDTCLILHWTKEKMLHCRLFVTVPSIEIWGVWSKIWDFFGGFFVVVAVLHLVEILLIQLLKLLLLEYIS